MLPLLLMWLSIGLDNVTGWNQLIDGNIISSSFIMYDTALMGWTIAILFIVYQAMLLLKTRNLVISFITGILFASMYVGSTLMSASGNPILKPISIQVIFVILVLELGAILYLWIWK
jgi:hypothetical protein